MTLDTLKIVTGTDRFEGVKESDIGRVGEDAGLISRD
jgi:hypothetical protein